MDAAGLAFLASGLGAGLALTGGAFGIGKLASAALEGSARQPEALGGLRVSMIIAAALIEGLGFFALIVCLLLGFKKSEYEIRAEQKWTPAVEASKAPAGEHK